MRGRRDHRSVLGAVLIATAALLAPAGASAGVTDKLPDLRMAKPNEFHLTSEGGRRLLRFSARIINTGDGPIIITGRRDPGSLRMRLAQRILQSDGSTRRQASTGFGRWGGDGHSHWHVQKFERYDIIPLDRGAGPDRVRGSKVGFCFLDTNAWDRSLPGAPQNPVFDISGCGDSRADTRIRVGVSVGWADRYGYYLPRQYFDTTGLPAGRYLICNTADSEEEWLETREGNNQSWVRINFRPGMSDPDQRVRILDAGRSACATQLPSPPATTGTWFLDWPEQAPIYFDSSAEVLCVIDRVPANG